MTTKPKIVQTHKRRADAKPSRTQAARCAAVIPNFDELPDSALMRLSQLVRDPKHPTRPAPLGISASTLWRKVAGGTFPGPVRVSSGITAWRVADVRAWLKSQSEAA